MSAVATLRDLVLAARRRLAAAGIDSAALDASVLLEMATGLTRAGVVARLHDPAPEAVIAAFEALVARRAAREPLAYLVGRREFWSLPFQVGPGVLIPRPESEHVIEAALEAFPDRARPLRILDVGVGSGCLLLTLLHEYPAAAGVGTDVGPAALAWAQANARSLDLAGRARLVQGALAADETGPFDLLLCNPPYVATDDLATLESELAFEPREALDGGADGLDVYRQLVPLVPSLLTPDGIAVLEHGAGQEAAIAALARDAGLSSGSRRDLAGRPRVLVLARVSAGGDA
jgi:release factor glutamine methyltransferase